MKKRFFTDEDGCMWPAQPHREDLLEAVVKRMLKVLPAAIEQLDPPPKTYAQAAYKKEANACRRLLVRAEKALKGGDDESA